MSRAWQVVAVFDPAGGGRDFAYTVGLHDRGHPELLLWARPTDGDDPGTDWRLSNHDLGRQLDDLAAQLIAGTIVPGADLDVTYDDGATRASLRLQPVVAAHGGMLEAFQTHPDARVCEVRWSLQRAPIGPRRELDPDETTAARARLASLVGADDARSERFPASAPFGPHTAVLAALRARVQSMQVARADHLIAAVHLGFRPETDLAAIQAAARPVGLHHQIVQAIDLAHDDAHEICARAYADDAELRRPTTSLFTAVLAAAYGVEVAHHVVPESARGTSEVLWALLDPGWQRTHRFVAATRDADRALAEVLEGSDAQALAATVADLDDDTIGALVSLWPLAAAAGHGSGLWLALRLVRSVAELDDAWRGAAALATAGYEALGIEPPPELGPEVADITRRVAADVRATSLRRAC